MRNKVLIFLLLVIFNGVFAQKPENRKRAEALGVDVGYYEKGALNCITDVEGVLVGHTTRIEGDNIRTGVSSILPHSGNIFQEKVPAAIFCYNSFGKLAGSTQVAELGNIETPIILTNTLSVGIAVSTVVKYTLSLSGNENIRSVNAVVGETNDGYLNDIRGQHITENDVMDAIVDAKGGLIEEGCVGAGTGTTALGFKGGIGTASRLTLAIDGKKYTVGVLVQSNFGRNLLLNGIPFTREMKEQKIKKPEDGSCMIVIATDAPLSPRNLERLAKRAFAGMARTTDQMSNSSGDYAIAFSTAYRIPYSSQKQTFAIPGLIRNSGMTTLFHAVEEATQEAIYNSLFMAESTKGMNGREAEAIPLEKTVELLKEYNQFKVNDRLLWRPKK